MNRRAFIKALAAGIIGVPLLKPKAQTAPALIENTPSLWTTNCDTPPYVFIPNWFPNGKGAWLKPLNGEVQEIERQLAKMFPEEDGLG